MCTIAAGAVAGFAGPCGVLAAAALFALVVGRRCERLSAAPVLLGLGFAGAVAPVAGWTALALDATVLVALTGVALACKPLWTLFAAAFQLLTALTRLLALTSGANPALEIALQAWGYALSMALVVGAWRARRERPAEHRARFRS